ncbi:MAG: hypothetical protein AAB152_11705 [Candidatus Coatesbacteria bacterium]
MATSHDRLIVRGLSLRVAEVAALPGHAQTRERWTKINRLERTGPLVWINEIPFWEFPDHPELKCECEAEFARGVEWSLREKLWHWTHARCDMVVDPVVYSPVARHDSGYGIGQQEVRGRTDYGMNAADYLPILRSEADLGKIRTPVITPDHAATDRAYAATCELVGDALPVERRGLVTIWFAPWDELVRWWGITELYEDMIERPAFVHAGIRRLMDAWLARLDQLERLGLLSVSNGNHRVGSGGLGITDELPQKDYDGVHARAIDQWGMSTGQIFSEASPAMHEEFCLRYELEWLSRFGLNAYGCCEPLHCKMHIVRAIPRLRRVSMSRFINIERGAEAVGRDFIFSYKPNPGVFAGSSFDRAEAERELRRVLDATRDCHVELIMKDISTCRADPARITAWCDLAVDLARQYR